MVDDGQEGKGLDYVEGLKKLLRMADCPEILIENPYLLKGKKPTDADYAWAEGVIKRYEEHNKAINQAQTPALPVADGEGEKVGNAVMIDFLNFCSGKFTPDDSDETWTDNDGEKYTPNELLDLYFQWDKRIPVLPSAVTGGMKETNKEKKYELALQIIACWNPQYYSSKSMNDVARKALGGEPLPFDPPSEGQPE